MFRTITSRFAGTCRRCNEAFEAGTKIRYGGPGRTYHIKKDCSSCPSEELANPYSADEQAVGGYPVPATSLESSPDAAGEWGIDARMAEARQPKKHNEADSVDRADAYYSNRIGF